MYHIKPKTITTRYNGFVPLQELDETNDSFPECLEKYGVSKHIRDHRRNRFDAMQVNAGNGDCLARFEVRREGRNEIHTLYDNGIITTQIKGSPTIVTFMFARPEQIKEYWIGMGKAFPNDISYILDIADENQYLAWHD